MRTMRPRQSGGCGRRIVRRYDCYWGSRISLKDLYALAVFKQIGAGGDDAFSCWQPADYGDFTAIDRTDVYAVEQGDFSGARVGDEEHAIFPVFRLYDCGKGHLQRRRPTGGIDIRELQGADHTHLQQVIAIRYGDLDLEITGNRVGRR